MSSKKEGQKSNVGQTGTPAEDREEEEARSKKLLQK
jgi:hypothetical protein